MSHTSPLQLTLFDAPAKASAGGVGAPLASDRLEERARALAFAVSGHLGAPVRLAITDNRTSMVSFHRGATGLKLRVHHMFLDAPPAVVQALAEYAGKSNPQGSALLDRYIRQEQARIRDSRSEHGPALNPRGRCVDLGAVFDRLNVELFSGDIQARIGWGRMPGKRRRKSIRLGVYDHQLREIRIHPALDHPSVPRFFVEFIVFHEMLHQLFPSTVKDWRRVHHPRAFRERERAFPRYREALQWEKENLRQLLRA